MNQLRLDSVKLKAIAACVPKDIEYTHSYTHFSPQEAVNFEKRVGVKQKRTSYGKITASDLCFHAAQKAMTDLDWRNETIGLLIFISQTADYAVPPTSVLLQNTLGLPKSTMLLDIRQGCTGWVNGISVAGSLMKTFKISRALVLVGETAILSQYDDPSTYPLMGDAGTATALELDAEATPILFNTLSDGSLFKAIIAPQSGARHISENPSDNKNLSVRTQMNGNAIFEFSTSVLLPSIHLLLEEANLQIADIDHFIFHQANKMITESLRKKLGISEQNCPYSLTEFGNTSSASIPLTIVTQIGSIKGRFQKIFCSSFGVGLSLANMIFDTTDMHCSALQEI